ncbi:MAG: Cell envelope-related transcriptional attenuator [candidate division WS6 bacterium GW2011_GWF2_39_15]|uniref:Cell envelope-related transcriptional attenuator n=1 Tax=candidate division WS6 bacterium GW2011_GWF2_39_15 TaxID=1619100 RepID=A0A0G0MNH3_9BACT|nr:MAG: Cell envelope-related transcriptional attenuator [candidate division WS6 bacterium GW2011_GWF2_39_15]
MNVKDTNSKILLKDQKNKVNEIQTQSAAKLSGDSTKRKFDKKLFFKWAIRVFIVLVVLGGGFYAYKVLSFTNAIGLKIRPEDLLSSFKEEPELKKDSSGKYTNVLLVGIDSRGEKSTLRNTDSMIIASYNYETGNTVMYSVPRDLYVPFPDNPSYYQKINAMYASGENKKKGGGLEYLEKTLKSITGLEVQYHAMIDLQGFKKIIDTLGGITVNVENSFTDDCYPVDGTQKITYYCGLINGKAQTITFKAGPQTMNGTIALQYARSRHSSDNGEGTDFARGRRQQRVIAAIKDKFLTTETLLNPQKILETMDALEKNLIVTEFTTEDIQAAVNLANKQKENPGKVFSFVLDPSIGAGKVLKGGNGLRCNLPGFCPNPSNPPYSVQSVAGTYPTYTELLTLVQLIQLDPQLYKEDAIIRVYDTGIGYIKAKTKTEELQKKYPYLNILFFGTLRSDKEGNIVYGSNSTDFVYTVDMLAKYFQTENKTKPDFITSNLYGEDLVVLLGKEVVKVEAAPQTDNQTTK